MNYFIFLLCIYGRLVAQLLWRSLEVVLLVIIAWVLWHSVTCKAHAATNTSIYHLEWDYPTNAMENIMFEVWRSPTPVPQDNTNWTRIAVTSGTNWAFMATGASGFFKVRASNVVNGLTSEWAH